MADDNVLLEQSDGVAVITLNRPDLLNAMTRDMFETVRGYVQELGEDPEVRVVILTGSGRGFCSGVDVSGHDFSSNDGRRPLAHKPPDTPGLLRVLPKPTIAAVNGVAVGAGLGLALACDIRIASEEARFSTMFARIGLPALDGVGWLLPRVVGPSKAMELLYSGEMINAVEAERIGLVSSVTASDDLMDRSMAMATLFAQNAPFGVATSKYLVRESLTRGYEDYMNVQYAASLDNRIFAAHDIQEAAQARKEKRSPIFRGVGQV